MIRGLYTAATGMIVGERRQENISNNLANINNNSFKRTLILSKSTDSSKIKNKDTSKNNIGALSLGTEIDEYFLDFSQGNLNESDSNLDFAINGKGFFVVEGNNGERLYTRNGNFKIDGNGRLTTIHGHPVLGVNSDKGNEQYIYTNENLKVDTSGKFAYGNGYNSFLIADFDDLQDLKKTGENYYSTESEAKFNSNVNDVFQGYIEGSNVNATDEIVSMLETSRHFQTNYKILQQLDETLSKTVNEVGRLR